MQNDTLDKATPLSHNKQKGMCNSKRDVIVVGDKGTKTKQLIIEKSYELFAKHGFKNISMQDICDATRLSRGGLYRHYDNVELIFAEVLEHLNLRQKIIFGDKMEEGASAKTILEETLVRMEEEMQDAASSLSFAIYEFSKECSEDYIKRINLHAKKYWKELIEYGIERGEFKTVDVSEAVDVIMYSYQGVRMFSQIINLEKNVAKNITNHIRKFLEVDYE